MEDENKNNLFFHGFVRTQMGEYTMSIPLAIIDLIGHWYSMEYVHVIYKRNGDHWKIDVDKIIELRELHFSNQ